jgi:hypothetical protein
MTVSTIQQMQEIPSRPGCPSETSRVCRFTAILARSLWNKLPARRIHPPVREEDAEERHASRFQDGGQMGGRASAGGRRNP